MASHEEIAAMEQLARANSLLARIVEGSYDSSQRGLIDVLQGFTGTASELIHALNNHSSVMAAHIEAMQNHSGAIASMPRH